jgi:hypothetical protein
MGIFLPKEGKGGGPTSTTLETGDVVVLSRNENGNTLSVSFQLRHGAKDIWWRAK